MSPGLIALVVVLVVTTAFGLWRRNTDGRFQSVQSPQQPAGERLSADELGAELGVRATLVQFSSAFCAPCRTARVVLGDVAANTPGVTHVEIAAEDQIELIRRFDVRRTPTLLVLDAAGRVRHRATGAPDRAAVLAALATVAG